jgi:hypothetical protein
MAKTWMLGVAAAAMVGMAGCGGDDAGVSFVKPDEETEGRDAAALLEEFWVGVNGLPAEETLFVDPAACDMGMSADGVYFVPTWTAPGESSTSCTAPEGATLVIQPVGVLCLEDDVDQADVTCLNAQWNVTASSVTIDGEPVEDLDSYQVDTEQFEATPIDGNVFDLAATPQKYIARAQVVRVSGLEPGAHTIVVGGDFGDGEFAGSLTVELDIAEG